MIAYWSSIAALLIRDRGNAAICSPATVLIGRYARAQTPRHAIDQDTPTVTILKPLHGDDAGLLRQPDVVCRAALCRSRRSSAASLTLMTLPLRWSRPARRAAKRTSSYIDAALHGANRKVSNLINCAAHPA
jgi:hypothetical protein